MTLYKISAVFHNEYNLPKDDYLQGNDEYFQHLDNAKDRIKILGDHLIDYLSKSPIGCIKLSSDKTDSKGNRSLSFTFNDDKYTKFTASYKIKIINTED